MLIDTHLDWQLLMMTNAIAQAMTPWHTAVSSFSLNHTPVYNLIMVVMIMQR